MMPHTLPIGSFTFGVSADRAAAKDLVLKAQVVQRVLGHQHITGGSVANEGQTSLMEGGMKAAGPTYLSNLPYQPSS